MSQYFSLIQKFSLIGLTNLLYGLQGLILLPLLSKNLSIGDYGIWIQILVTIGLIPSLVMLGLPYTMVRFLAGKKTKKSIQEVYYSILGIILISGGIASIIIFFLSYFIAKFLFNGFTDIVNLLAIVIFIECIIQLQYNYFRALQKTKKYSFFFLIRVFLQILLASIFVLSGYGIFGALFGYCIANFFIMLVMTSQIILEIGIIAPKFLNVKEFISFGFPTVPGNLSMWTVRMSDRYLIGLTLGTMYVGYYAPGYELGNIISIFIAPLSFLLPAVLSKYYDENRKSEVNFILVNSLKFFLIFSIPSVVGLSFLSKPILTVLSTNEIASESYLITPFVAISTLLFGVYVIVGQVHILEKNTKLLGVVWIIAGAINLILNIILLPFIGIIAAALTTLIAFSIALLITLYYSRDYFPNELFFVIKKIFPRILISSILFAPIIIYLNPNGIITITFVILLSGLMYLLTFTMIGGFTNDEIKFIKKLTYRK
ncbi:oligosaccharide flippase family protein [Methanospirillum sp. J.3.6.1-F.2.7.3]|uniref:Oligosaccharide flippase family protein n=1 Tax=Methanospirillum purgamenti TaxID=2834276 RepID=A0A8E7EHD8_9EURY|nr:MULTISPECIES: oligosaccharide flippase family protein [Methanospirillum]MDX8549500.1 oligosaccharide flippase family protein [Methanospirillum hungatei]QVV89218.1 oligosaccharide flippase family protein [Methanospirillum sp. J.3.6.1-F.2.7.3]